MRCTKPKRGLKWRKRNPSCIRFVVSTLCGDACEFLWFTLNLFLGSVTDCQLSPLPKEKKPEQEPAQSPAPLVSPDVHADGSVTFCFRAPNARDVKLAREGAEPVGMQKDDQGVWNVTTVPLPPDYYGYSFIADGVRSLDASNPCIGSESTFSGEFCPCSRTVLSALGIKRRPAWRDSSSLLQVGGGGR